MRRGENGGAGDGVDAMMILDRQCQIIFATGTVRVVLGYDSRELIGKSAFDLLFCYNQSKARLQYEAILQQPGLTLRGMLRLKHRFCISVRVRVTLCNQLHQPSVGGVLVTIRKISRQSNNL